jgi:hypothetical protein
MLRSWDFKNARVTNERDFHEISLRLFPMRLSVLEHLDLRRERIFWHSSRLLACSSWYRVRCSIGTFFLYVSLVSTTFFPNPHPSRIRELGAGLVDSMAAKYYFGSCPKDYLNACLAVWNLNASSLDNFGVRCICDIKLEEKVIERKVKNFTTPKNVSRSWIHSTGWSRGLLVFTHLDQFFPSFLDSPDFIL